MTRCVVILLLLGFAAKNAFVDLFALALALVVMAFLLGLNLLSDLRERPLMVSSGLIMTAFTILLMLAVEGLGVYAVFWAFPAIVGARFVSSDRLAMPMAVALTLCLPVIVLLQGDVGNAARAFGGLILTTLYLAHLHGYFSGDRWEVGAPATAFDGTAPLIEPGETAGVLRIALDQRSLLHSSAEARGQLLPALASRIRADLTPNEPVFRMSEGEYLVLLKNWSDYESVAIAERLRAQIAEAELTEGQSVTVSIGVSTAHADVAFSEALKQAKDSLSLAQSAGGDQVICASME